MLYMFGFMWFTFGIGAIIATGLNIIWTIKGKDAKWFRFISLSLTALTLCAFYGQAAHWAAIEDWSALMDVLPGVSRALWFLAVASVVINSVSLFKKSDR